MNFVRIRCGRDSFQGQVGALCHQGHTERLRSDEAEAPRGSRRELASEVTQFGNTIFCPQLTPELLLAARGLDNHRRWSGLLYGQNFRLASLSSTDVHGHYGHEDEVDADPGETKHGYNDYAIERFFDLRPLTGSAVTPNE